MKKEQLFDKVREVYRTVPAYIDLARDRKIDLTSLTEFEQFPIMEKQYMIQHEMGSIAPASIRDYMMGNLISKRTSGSTGQYLEVLWNDADYKKSMIELWLKRAQYYDIYPEDRMVYFYTHNKGNTKYEYYKNTIGINKKLLLKEHIHEVIETIINVKATWALLQPSVAEMLCTYIEEHYTEVPFNFKYIEFSGEILTDSVRKMAKQTFRCEVADQYGANEVGSIAYECPYGCKHIMESNVFVEIADDLGNILTNSDELKTAEGQIIITSKTNHAMPFYRYNLGDMVLVKQTYCRCGGNSKVIEVVTGRSNDYAVFEDGYKIHSYVFVEIFDFINNLTGGSVKQFRIEQKTYQIFEVIICVDEEADKQHIEQMFLTKLDNAHLKKSKFYFNYTERLFKVHNEKKHVYFKSLIDVEEVV